MKRAVIVICDGHRADLVRPELCPGIAGLAARGRHFQVHRSVFPSVTRSSSASIATGCHPGRHGLHGNAMGLRDGEGYAVRDVGHPEFRTWMREANGRTLRVPTLAERLSGDVVVFSNVSPGAAYFQDPDGHGWVYHRNGSFGPGLRPLPEGLEVSHDAAGDRAMTERFCDEVLLRRRPAVAVLWLCEPDHTMHATELGSPAHLEAIAAADACVSRVAATVDRLAASGDDVLFVVGSDHGQESTAREIALDRLLVDAGLKRELKSTDVAVAGQGTSGLVYIADAARDRLPALVAWLQAQDFIDDLLVGDDLAAHGLAPADGLAIGFSMRKSTAANAYGVAGLSDTVVSHGAKPKAGLGQHGGLGRFEQAPFLMVAGAGFGPGTASTAATCIVDIAPTVLAHLGQPGDGMDGRPLYGR